MNLLVILLFFHAGQLICDTLEEEQVFADFTGFDIENQDVDMNTPSVSGLDEIKNKNSTCENPNETATFIRASKLHKMGLPTLVLTMDTISDCTENCRNNIDPIENRPFKCFGFNFLNAEQKVECQFFSDKQGHFPLKENVQKKSTYFEKICLEMPLNNCMNKVFSFELRPNMFLNVLPVAKIRVQNRQHCLQKCQENSICRAVNFDKRNGLCQLLNQTSSFSPELFKPQTLMDYIENVCIQEQSRCLSGRKIDFIVIKNADIPNFGISLGIVPINDCMKQCVDGAPQSCRSIKMDKIGGECFLVEDSDEQLIGSADYDIYEPICIKEEIKTPCGGLYLYEKVENANFVSEELISQHRDQTIESCMEKCLVFEHCLLFVYGKTDQRCKLFAVNRHSNSTKVVTDTSVDLYEMSCDRSNMESKLASPSVFPGLPAMDKPGVNPGKPGYKDYDENSKANGAKTATLDEPNNFLPQEYPQPPAEISRISNFSPAPEPSAPALPSRPGAIILSPSVGSVEQSTSQPYAPALPATPSASIQSPAVENPVKDEVEASGMDVRTPSDSSICDEPQSVLIESGRILRQEHRSLHHIKVQNLTQCEKLCALSNIECVTYAYDRENMDCILSTKSIDEDKKFEAITQPNPSYDLYAFLGASKCFEMMDGNELIHKIKNQPTTKLTPPPKTTISTTPLTTQRIRPNKVEIGKAIQSTIKSETHKILYDATEIPKIEDDRDVFDVEEEDDDKIDFTTTPKLATKKSRFISTTTHLPTVTSSKDLPTSKKPKEKLHGSKLGKLENFRLPKEMITLASEEVTGTPEMPHKVPETPEMMKMSQDKVNVTATCMEMGVNITFDTHNMNYTGAVYAAERFAQCRIFVTNKNSFHIFINRPKYNNWCNALELDDKLNLVIVMSNDMVMPYDVTTKDDLFYQITCDYKEKQSPAIVHSGIVVGGPYPKSISSTRQHDERTYVILQILKNGNTVSNVFIGEQLTALIESDVDPRRLRVADCNATRVGGRDPLPDSVQLIKDGCTLMPQVIGNMSPAKRGLEAPLTAFRIDGSDQIDILCSVIICKENCAFVDSCPSKRNRRGAKIEIKNMDDKITVDHRLRVLVQDDPSRAEENFLSRDFCIKPKMFLLSMGLLVLTLIALAVSMCTNHCRKRIAHRTLSDTSEINFHNQINSLPRFGKAMI